jgi:eukaryotic-like serine/threonine-protein kinase
MNTRQDVNREAFLANVRQSGLLSDAELGAVDAKLPESHRGRVVARALVDLGLLTKFQAERILVGRTAGFQLGQYRILDQLGRGGMGRVFKAQHRTMNRIVALKVLAPTVMKSERACELFLREVRAAAQLNHPNIVAAYDANECEGRYYLVLEYVDGPNLEQLVREQGPLPVSQACDFVRQTALGLLCAHERGMLHRDIKPANLLLQRGGLDGKSPDLVKISDFGLARLQAPNAKVDGEIDAAGRTILTKENTVMGTPDYLSPEQARNLHKADIRSDLYSLGCSFYHLLTGRVPFAGGKVMDKLIRHGTELPQAIAEMRPEVPGEVIAIVNRLMAKNPDDRFQTPAELVEALTPFAVGGSTAWAPHSPVAADLDESDETSSFGSDPDLAPSASDDLSALVNTLSNDLSPTPPNAALPRKTISIELFEAEPKTGFNYGPILAIVAAFGLLGGMGLAGMLGALAVLLRR